MTLAAHGTPPLAFTSRTPSIVILGSDALLAALPATPVQLAHACLRVGFQHVVPASWGDELVAGAMLEALADRAGAPAIQCSCPLVAHRLLSVGTELHPFLVPLVAPPVALARYLRAVHGGAHPRITYVGRCPGADEESIDARLTPDELLVLFAERHVVLLEQPLVFDSVLPPDRRRHLSQPGGVPTPEALWVDGGHRTLEELSGQNFAAELAQVLLSDQEVLVNPAPALGCACAGAVPLSAGRNGRAELQALEPPRSRLPVVDSRVPLDLALPITPLHAPPPIELAPVAAPSRAAVTAVSAPARPLDVPPSAPVVPPSDPFAETVREQPAHREPEVIALGTASEEPLPDDSTRAAPPREQVTALVTSVEPDAPAVGGPAPTAAHGRSPVNGVPRTVQGEPPLARHADGRQLPRTWVLRKRHSPRTAMGAIHPPVPASQPEARSAPVEPVQEPAIQANAAPVEEIVPSTQTPAPDVVVRRKELEAVEQADVQTDVIQPVHVEPREVAPLEVAPLEVAPQEVAPPQVDPAQLELEPDPGDTQIVFASRNQAGREEVRGNGAGGHAQSIHGGAAAPARGGDDVPLPGSDQASLPHANRPATEATTPGRLAEPPVPVALPMLTDAATTAVAEHEAERRPSRPRPVELPVDRTAVRARHAPGAGRTAAGKPVATVPATKISWKVVVAMVALVALVSAAVGVAIGAYVTAR